MLGGDVAVVVVVVVVAVGCLVFLPGFLVVAAAPLEGFLPRIPGRIIQYFIYIYYPIGNCKKKLFY